MLRIGIVGLGKMGMSHLAILRAHPRVEIAGVCDTARYILDGLAKYTGIPVFSDYATMLREARLDGVLIATPSAAHGPMVRAALAQGLDVFCEKPFCLDPAEARALAHMARELGRVGQVGYHYRYVASFAEVRRLIATNALGPISHIRAEAYGAVVLRPQPQSWRTKKVSGGGCLYDYAAHPLNLVNWVVGPLHQVDSAVLSPIFSSETDDEVYAVMRAADGTSVNLSVNWSDPSVRKMTTKLSLWGRYGKLYADRQEVQLFLRDDAPVPDGYRPGWTVKYTTELTPEVDYYLRGEEYSAQIWDWVTAMETRRLDGVNSFSAAAETDAALAAIVARAADSVSVEAMTPAAKPPGGVVKLWSRR